jgi:hypothetical protein
VAKRDAGAATPAKYFFVSLEPLHFAEALFKIFDWEIEAWKDILSWSGGLRFSLFTAFWGGALKAHMYRLRSEG